MQLMETLSRRRLGLLLGGIAAAPAQAQNQKPGTAIHQEVDFEATPARIYEVLLDAKQFSAFTKDTAEIEPRPGGTFKLFGGRIEGRNIELAPNQRIVQAWRPAYWPAGLYSIVKFELAAHGSGARIILDHTGFTEDKWQGLNEGWPLRYWDPLRKYLASPK
ncbi:MAG: SRPBCC domain-containing protein [Bryobacteraceae bacterium]|jgi:activator of HSP90 ATPase